jgi:tRNA (guanine-N7-)-methyltransferase
MDVLCSIKGLENVFGDRNWAVEHKRPETKFELRGRKLGHGVWDLLFRLANPQAS